MLSWNQARVDVVETCSLASAGELSVLFTCGTRARWSSTTRAGLRAQFTALSQHFARVSVETIAYTFYRHYIFCFYNGSKLLVFSPHRLVWGKEGRNLDLVREEGTCGGQSSNIS